jgi:hypothetical protein
MSPRCHCPSPKRPSASALIAEASSSSRRDTWRCREAWFAATTSAETVPSSSSTAASGPGGESSPSDGIPSADTAASRHVAAHPARRRGRDRPRRHTPARRAGRETSRRAAPAGTRASASCPASICSVPFAEPDGPSAWVRSRPSSFRAQSARAHPRLFHRPHAAGHGLSGDTNRDQRAAYAGGGRGSNRARAIARAFLTGRPGRGNGWPRQSRFVGHAGSPGDCYERDEPDATGTGRAERRQP